MKVLLYKEQQNLYNIQIFDAVVLVILYFHSPSQPYLKWCRFYSCIYSVNRKYYQFRNKSNNLDSFFAFWKIQRYYLTYSLFLITYYSSMMLCRKLHLLPQWHWQFLKYVTHSFVLYFELAVLFFRSSWYPCANLHFLQQGQYPN